MKIDLCYYTFTVFFLKGAKIFLTYYILRNVIVDLIFFKNLLFLLPMDCNDYMTSKILIEIAVTDNKEKTHLNQPSLISGYLSSSS
jgi:hypothetical protein